MIYVDPYNSALEYFQNIQQSPVDPICHRTSTPTSISAPQYPTNKETPLTSSAQPWPFTFQCGDEAWAKGSNTRWRRVKIVGVGRAEPRMNCVALWYIASWKHQEVNFTQQFCPMDGRLKPASYRVTKLLMEEGVLIQGPIAAAFKEDDDSGILDSGDRCVIC